MRHHHLYQCEICGFLSGDRESVERCEATESPMPSVKPGDVVRAGSKYGWWSAEESWFLPVEGAEPGSGANGHGRPGYPLFLVLDIVRASDHRVACSVAPGPSSHRWVVVLYSPAHANRKSGDALCWTSEGSHYTPVKVREVKLAELERLRIRSGFGSQRKANLL